MKRELDGAQGGGVRADQTILTGFRPEHSALWSRHPICINHALEETGLFTDEALADLIEACPRENYDLLHMGVQGSGHMETWSEGELGEISGREAIAAVKAGRFWLSLRRLHEFDARHRDLLETIFDELGGRMPGFDTYKHNMGILISSPGAQVYYHADIPGQSLWQVRGEKRVYVYPACAPFLSEDQMEQVILGVSEEEIDYEPWFDDYAQVQVLKPGEMLHWPLNAPHRVENLDCLNVSMTTEHWTDDIRNMYALRYANGVLRRTFAMTPRAPYPHGLRFWAKAALAAAVKKSGWMKRSAVDSRVTWRLDTSAENAMTPIEPYVR